MAYVPVPKDLNAVYSDQYNPGLLQPKRGQDQGAAEPDEAPARLLRRWCGAGRSAVLPAQNPYRRQHGGDLHDHAHAALFSAGHV